MKQILRPVAVLILVLITGEKLSAQNFQWKDLFNKGTEMKVDNTNKYVLTIENLSKGLTENDVVIQRKVTGGDKEIKGSIIKTAQDTNLVFNLSGELSVLDKSPTYSLLDKKNNKERKIVILKDDKLVETIVSTSSKSCSPEYVFITKDMFPDGGRYDLSSYENKIDSRRKRKLPGEYILMYDFKYGDYDMYKRRIKNKAKSDSIGASSGKLLEFYQKKNSMFFSPQVGSQFKVEVVNYSDTSKLNMELSYRDNYLEEEARFKTLTSTFNTNSDKIGAPVTGGTESVEVGKLTLDKLITLKNDLCYYNQNFQFSSFTADKHQQNVSYIMTTIKEKFELQSDKIIEALLEQAGTNVQLKSEVKAIEVLLNQLSGYQSVAFNSFRLKNRDNVILRLKDEKNRVKKEEELRMSGGFKIDFSSGVFLTGLKDDSYVFKDTTVQYTRNASTVDTTGKIIIKEKASVNKINFGILMHGYPRISSNYNLGLTTGISTNTNLDLNVLFGGSVLLGSTRRIVLSGGWIWGKANRLSNTVEENFHRTNPDPIAPVTGKPIFYSSPNNVVPVVSDWYRSWFVGITFNFSQQ